jgi:2-polyprenyl-3-methyl-5-hydroxy-6-metoxy-1,4-benzoquinol methylase
VPTDDRKKWDERYGALDPYGETPSGVLTRHESLLPSTGKALDLAGGNGRHACWLAERGMEVTIADISSKGLERARQRAESTGLQIQYLQMDLEADPFPTGPWSLVLSCLYLWRPLIPAAISHLSPGGLLVILQPTVTNLERHTRPPRKYLLQEDELLSLARGLEIVHHEQGWLDDGRHDAFLVARKTP